MTARHLLLVGGGHSHVEVVRRFGHRPLPGTTVTLLSRDRFTPYSGMLPGYIAGHYRYRDVHIDLQALAATAGIDFVQASATGLDRDAHCCFGLGRCLPLRCRVAGHRLDTGSR